MTMLQNNPDETAMIVRGLVVVDNQPYRSPYAKDRRTGEGLEQPQTRVLTLSDGTTTYGCLHCPYTSNNLHSIRPHLNKHRARKPARVPTVSELREMSAADLMAKLTTVTELEADRDQWKARALAAEKSLQSLRKALKGIG